LVLLLLLLAT